MIPSDDFPALLRAQLLQSKSQVPRYWREANQKQREAICYTAQLPATFAGPLFPIGKGDRESIRQAIIALEWQSLFHSAMSYYEWHSGCVPELQSEEKPREETGPAERLAKSKGLLMTLVNNPQTANYGQEKTPITGAANT
ncbi:hypothetical protein [Aeromonas enterica]